MVVGGSRKPASIRTVGALLAFGTVFVAFVATQWPFQYRPYGASVLRRWSRADWSWWPRDASGDVRIDRDFVLNLLMLVPLGIGFALWRRAGAMRVVVEGLLLGAAISVMLEAAQLVTRYRFTSFADVWRNAVGCMVGCVIGLWILRERERITHD
jgi:hypothetical protein